VKKNSSLSTTQWLMVGSIIVGMAGIYYKHEELKAAHGKIKDVLVEKTLEPARVEPASAPATRPKRLRKMN